MGERILVLAPHIGDEVLGCFSFLSKGTHVLWFGLSGRDKAARKRRQAEARTVAAATEIAYSLPANGQKYKHEDMLSDIEARIIALEPHTLLLPRPSFDEDHRAVFEAGFKACRQGTPLPFVRRVLVYDQVAASLWPRDSFQPTYFRPVDMEAKLGVWRLFDPDERDRPGEDALETLARMHGQRAGVPFAEGFELLRWVAGS